MNQLLQDYPAWLPAIDALVKASALLTIAALVAAALRRASAASRHLVWTCALLAALALPIVSIAVPRWQLPIFLLQSAGADVKGTPVVTPPPTAVEPPSIGRVAPPITGAPSESASPRPVKWSLSWSATLPAVWALGVLAILGRLAGGVLAVRLLSRRTLSAENAPWLPLARQLASELRVARVEFRRSPASMPMTWGIVRPVVVLPLAADAWPAERLRIALLHELAHVKRADCLTHMLVQLACALYWMHPLAWIAARRARAERERACDDLVLAYGTSGPDYADELLEIARLAPTHPFSATAAAGASLAMARRSQLEGRLMAILDPSVPRTGVSRVRTIAASVIAIVAVMPLAAVQPWAYAEGAVVPAPRTERSQQPTTTTPAPHGVTIPKQPPAVPSPQAPASKSALEGVKEGLKELAAQAIAEASPEIVAAVDLALQQNPRPKPEPNPNVEMDRNARSKADPKIVAALTEALKDTDKEVRESALHALVQMRDPGIYEPLVQALKDPSPGVRESAASGLARLRDKRAVGPLSSVLNDTSASVREQAVFALGQLRDASSVEPLTKALRDENAQVREQAAFALGQLRDQSSIAPLTSALKDTSANVREQAAFALGQLRARSAVDQLIVALKDEDVEVRGQAAFALGQIRDAKAVDALAAMLKDPNAEVRQQAAFALGQLAR